MYSTETECRWAGWRKTSRQERVTEDTNDHIPCLSESLPGCGSTVELGAIEGGTQHSEIKRCKVLRSLLRGIWRVIMKQRLGYEVRDF
jgi:hypothetical protein